MATDTLSGVEQRHSAASPKPLTAKGDRRAASILQAATTILARDGFGGATLRRIAAEAGADMKSLVYYFGTRRRLLRASPIEEICGATLRGTRAEHPDGCALIAMVDRGMLSAAGDWSPTNQASREAELEIAHSPIAITGAQLTAIQHGSAEASLAAVLHMRQGMRSPLIGCIALAGTPLAVLLVDVGQSSSDRDADRLLIDQLATLASEAVARTVARDVWHPLERAHAAAADRTGLMAGRSAILA